MIFDVHNKINIVYTCMVRVCSNSNPETPSLHALKRVLIVIVLMIVMVLVIVMVLMIVIVVVVILKRVMIVKVLMIIMVMVIVK